MRRYINYVSIFSLFLISIMGVAAQEPEPTQPATLEEILLQAQQLSQEFYRRELADFDFADYTTVYLIAPEVPESVQIATAENVAERLLARVVHTWAEVEQILTETPIDIMLIHMSAVDEVDAEWLRQAYRDGTMVVGFSTPFETLTELAGDACAENENPFVPERFDEWVLYLIYWASTTSPARKSQADASILENCNDDNNVSTTHGAMFVGLSAATGELEDIAGMLTLHILNRKQQLIQMPSIQEAQAVR